MLVAAQGADKGTTHQHAGTSAVELTVQINNLHDAEGIQLAEPPVVWIDSSGTPCVWHVIVANGITYRPGNSSCKVKCIYHIVAGWRSRMQLNQQHVQAGGGSWRTNITAHHQESGKCAVVLLEYPTTFVQQAGGLFIPSDDWHSHVSQILVAYMSDILPATVF